MNPYLIALFGTGGMLLVGYLFYGVLFKAKLTNRPKLSVKRATLSILGMYVLALVFLSTLQIIAIAMSASGYPVNIVGLGLYFGFVMALAFLVIPLLIDATYFDTSKPTLYIVIGNWFTSFLGLGLICGLLS